MEKEKNTEVDLRKVQMKSLDILLFFKKFCDEHNLMFYFCGGCCIGTLRHKGFIPWDDDVDVFMPRKDYELLKVLWEREVPEGKYTFCRVDENHFVRSQLTAIVDNDTTFIKENQRDLDIPHGIRLEILPLDGCPDSRWKRAIQLMWGLIYQVFCLQQPPTSKGKAFEYIGKIALALFPSWKARTKVWKFAEKQMSKYPIEKCDKVTELCVRWGYMTNEYPREAFDSVVYKEFEGYQMPIPMGYDTYLKIAFGDYMQIPPKEKQVTCHDAVLIDPDHSYKMYKSMYGAADERD